MAPVGGVGKYEARCGPPHFVVSSALHSFGQSPPHIRGPDISHINAANSCPPLCPQIPSSGGCLVAESWLWITANRSRPRPHPRNPRRKRIASPMEPEAILVEGSNPFQCNVCRRSYSRIDHLARHYRSRQSFSPRLGVPYILNP